MGCYNPSPLKRNIIPRFMKEREGIRNDERCIDHGERRILGLLKGGKLLSFPCNFSFCAWAT
jgi:hypothetical protein